jgi:hypothetical protein
MQQEINYRIKWWMGGLMIMTAAVIDLIQFLLTFVAIGLVMAPVITVGSVMLFWLWSKLLGISFFSNPKQLATFAAESLGELIPAVDALPLWTLGTIAIVIISRSEDKGGLIGKASNIASPMMNKGKVVNRPVEPRNMESLKPSVNRLNLKENNQQPKTQKRETPQYIKDWEESTKKLNDLQHKQLVEKHYKGGVEKYEQDAKKHADEWNKQKAA